MAALRQHRLDELSPRAPGDPILPAAALSPRTPAAEGDQPARAIPSQAVQSPEFPLQGVWWRSAMPEHQASRSWRLQGVQVFYTLLLYRLLAAWLMHRCRRSLQERHQLQLLPPKLVRGTFLYTQVTPLALQKAAPNDAQHTGTWLAHSGPLTLTRQARRQVPRCNPPTAPPAGAFLTPRMRHPSRGEHNDKSTARGAQVAGKPPGRAAHVRAHLCGPRPRITNLLPQNGPLGPGSTAQHTALHPHWITTDGRPPQQQH
jgi:hypothetical protein